MYGSILTYTASTITTARTNWNNSVASYHSTNNAPVITAIRSIESIGTVELTSASKSKIDTARSNYNGVTVNQSNIWNYSTLTAAESSFTTLENNEVTRINGLIADVGNFTATDASKITAAENATDSSKNWAMTLSYVTSRLTSGYASTISTARSNYTATNNSYTEIAAISPVSLSSQSALATARQHYDALASNALRTKVDTALGNANKLSAKESAYTGLVNTEVNRIVDLIDDVGNFTATDNSKITAAQEATSTSGNANWSNTDVSDGVASARSGYADTISTAASNYTAVNGVYTEINNLGTVKYQDASSTMPFSGEGITVSCNNETDAGNVVKGYSQFNDSAHGAYHNNVNAELTMRARIRAHGDNPVWGLSIARYTIGYDFANNRFGIMNNGMLAADTEFVCNVAASKSFELNTNRFYDFKFDIAVDHVALYVDDECVLYTTAAHTISDISNNYLIHYPRHVTADYAMVHFVCNGITVMDHVTGSDLVSNTNWTARGGFYSNSKQTFTSATIAKDSDTAISSAQSSYDALSSDALKNKVTNSGNISTARTAYNDLVYTRATINTNIIAAVTAIENLGTITLGSKDALDAADEKYTDVASDYRADVWNYSALTAAHTTYTDHKPNAYMSTTPDSSQVKANIYYELYSNEDVSKIKVTVNGNGFALSSLTPVPGAPDGKTRYLIPSTMPAKKMGDTINVSISYNYGTAESPDWDELHSSSPTVLWYCNQIIAGEATYGAKAVNVVKKMLNYGAAAQTYFNYNASTPVNASLNASDKNITYSIPANLAKFDSSGLVSALASASAPVKYSAINTTFLDDTSLYVAFKVTSGSVGDAKTWIKSHVKFGGAAVTEDTLYDETGKDGVSKYVIIFIKNIPIADINTDKAIAIASGNGTYTTVANLSVMNYIAIASEKGTDNMKALVARLYDYYCAVTAA